MNRFVIGGILAAIVMLLTGSLNRLRGDRSSAPNSTAAQSDSTEVSDLGSLPVEQAGQLVRRQSEVGNSGVSASPNTVFNDQPGTGMPPSGRPTISPNNASTAAQNSNVIPNTGAAATFPANRGDIAPIQPGLVQPGVEPQRPTDPDLDSIPALW